MKSILLSLVLGLSAQSVLAQSMFKVDETKSKLDLNECQLNHKKILDRYSNQVDTQLARILSGIEIEKGMRTDPSILKLYQQEASKNMVKAVMVSVLKEQLRNSSLHDLYSDPYKRYRTGPVFKVDDLQIDVERKVEEILKHQTIGNHVLHVVEHELVVDTFKVLGKNIYKSIGNGLVAKVATGAAFEGLTMEVIGSSLFSFGVHVLKGAGIGAVVSLLKEPLMGSRPSPESIWFDILDDYPEFVINPQWMKDAKSPDHPWMTHCRAIKNQGFLMTKTVKRFLYKEEQGFLNRVSVINRKKKDLAEDEQRLKYPALYDYKPQVADNTYVYKTNTVTSQVPYWAIKK